LDKTSPDQSWKYSTTNNNVTNIIGDLILSSKTVPFLSKNAQKLTNKNLKVMRKLKKKVENFHEATSLYYYSL